MDNGGYLLESGGIKPANEREARLRIVVFQNDRFDPLASSKDLAW